MKDAVEERQFVEAVARRTELSWLPALRITHAVLRSLAETLTRDEATAVATELSPPLADVLVGGTHAERFDLHELVLRVQVRTGASRELALTYIAVVLMTLGEVVAEVTLAPLRRALPPAIGFLLRPPPPPTTLGAA